MIKYVVIIEDNVNHSNYIKEAIEIINKNIEIIEFYDKIDDLIRAIKNKNAIREFEFNSSTLFIIDVALMSKKDEFGLELYNQLLKEFKNDFKYIVISQWDIADFKTPVSIDSDYFINKNLYNGYLLKFPIINIAKGILK